MAELPKAYQPSEAESKWYKYWYDHKLYDAKAENINEGKKAFTIVIPPPNVTGMLTLGHVLNNTIQDLYIRWKRMSRFEACWIPGTDHAGIATQTRVAATLSDEGVDYRQMGRDKFVERVWEWREEYGGIILKQLCALGVSLDWRRERFTMDEGLNEAVKEVFVRLFDKDLIYKGKKIVNWSPAAQTTLSDEEVNHKEIQDKLYTVRYKLIDDDDYITISTARPETIPGDVAIAVNGEDERYKDWIGKKVIVPLGGHEIPIIADEHADPEFGTGAVKITPAHDPNDYEVGLRHNLPMPNTINPDGSMNELAGPLAGLDRFVARKKAAKLLDEADAILKVEDYVHSVGFSERGGEQIEPYLSDQWYVSMEKLAEPAIEAVEQGHITFSPEHWIKTYMHWMKNIRDWPISRQLWWGHRIPVYYTEDGSYTAARSETQAREKLGLSADARLRQDKDVLDTWFSSWLWPFSVHGWGSSEKNEVDLKAFYPTDLLVTGPDIIFFWVARMIIAGLEFMDGERNSAGEPRKKIEELVPFRHVYFTSIIRDAIGRKLSKSLGNSPDPLEVINQYGADALRFTIIYLAPTGQDIRFSKEACEIGRNFANKIWNAGRFLMMKADETGINRNDRALPSSFEMDELEPISDSDTWILSRFHSALRDIQRHLNTYRINEYSKRIYEFIWNEFCDWYLEQMKAELQERDEGEAQQITRFALGIYDQVLRMLHPIMPFLTEEIWQTLAGRADGDSISVAEFPAADEGHISEKIEGDFELMQATVEAVRRMRSEAQVAPSMEITISIAPESHRSLQVFQRTKSLLKRLGRIGTLSTGLELEKPGLSKTEVVQRNEVHLHLEGLIDIEKEREKTEKEIGRVKRMITGTEKKLANEKFVANAPEKVVDKEREKLTNFQETLYKLQETLTQYN
ncbi:MAG: valine--tRNA ligase [Chlorobi bacterium]|nr:valine--tRNA ligase [Chlorobiota bacterium]